MIGLAIVGVMKLIIQKNVAGMVVIVALETVLEMVANGLLLAIIV